MDTILAKTKTSISHIQRINSVYYFIGLQQSSRRTFFVMFYYYETNHNSNKVYHMG